MKKKWFLSYKAALKAASVSETVVALPGHSRACDYYVIVPRGQFAFRGIPQTEARRKYGVFSIIYVIHENGFIPARAGRLKTAIKKGWLNYPVSIELEQYLQGYRTYNEMRTGVVNPYKEAARISHQICDASGKAGHEARQIIRKIILKKF